MIPCSSAVEEILPWSGTKESSSISPQQPVPMTSLVMKVLRRLFSTPIWVSSLVWFRPPLPAVSDQVIGSKVVPPRIILSPIFFHYITAFEYKSESCHQQKYFDKSADAAVSVIYRKLSTEIWWWWKPLSYLECEQNIGNSCSFQEKWE